MLRPHAHPDRPSRAAGLAAFAVGIGLLVAVFVFAYHLFSQPVPGLNLSNPPQGAPPPAANIGLSLAAFGEKLLLLALLTLVGALVASRGIHLCFAAGQGPFSGAEAPEPAASASKNGHAALPPAPVAEAGATETSKT